MFYQPNRSPSDFPPRANMELGGRDGSNTSGFDHLGVRWIRSATCLLELEFRSGALYRYLSVPADLYRDLLAADSKGRFFNRFIRDCFPTSLVAPAAPAKTI